MTTKEEILAALNAMPNRPKPPRVDRPKPKPQLEVVEGERPVRDELKVGPTREVGEMLTSIDPRYRPSIVKVKVLERLESGSKVEFDYNPLRRFEKEVPPF